MEHVQMHEMAASFFKGLILTTLVILMGCGSPVDVIVHDDAGPVMDAAVDRFTVYDAGLPETATEAAPPPDLRPVCMNFVPYGSYPGWPTGPYTNDPPDRCADGGSWRWGGFHDAPQPYTCDFDPCPGNDGHACTAHGLFGSICCPATDGSGCE